MRLVSTSVKRRDWLIVGGAVSTRGRSNNLDESN